MFGALGPAYSPAYGSPIHSPPPAPFHPGSAAPWRTPRAPQFSHAVVDEPPAWKGSLRSSNTPLTSDTHAGAAAVPHHHGGAGATVNPHVPKVQSMHYGSDGTQEYRQRAGEGGAESDSARAVHLQYNSPLGLYSRENAQQAMSGQLNGRPGEGTIG